MTVLHKLLQAVHKVTRRIGQAICRPSFRSCGTQVVFDPLNSNFSYRTIEIGSYVFIGGRAWFSCSHGRIRIGSHVMFGPGVHILGGNHRFSTVGVLMYDDHEKSQGDDLGVTIEDDVWIGANAVILEGVTIARGSVIGAGSVVTRSTVPYSINAGTPAKMIASRFNESQLTEHIERLLKDAKV